MPTNEQLVEAVTRLTSLESTVTAMALRIQALESSLAAANTKVDTLNTFYGQALGDTTARLMSILDKVTSGTTTP